MRRISIIRKYASETREIEDWVTEETLLELIFPAGQRRYFVITPEKIKEFVYGHLWAEGLIGAPEEVEEYREELDVEQGDRIRVSLVLRNTPASYESSIIWPSCSQSVPESLGLLPLEPRPIFAPDIILDLPAQLNPYIEDFRLTGAYHYAFLVTAEPKVVVHAKDIGRHNAVDKVLGAALLAGFSTENALLYTTGRISTDIVAKALRARVPLVVSPGAAFLGAINLARRYNLGLIGFLRGKRFNVYSEPRWLKTDP